MTIRKISALCLSMLLTLSLASAAFAADAKYTVANPKVINFGYTIPQVDTDPYVFTCNKFIEYLAKFGDGSVQFKQFADGQLGQEREMVEGMQLGTLDGGMITNAYLSELVPQNNLINLPFLVTSYPAAKKVFMGDFGKELMGLYEGTGVKLLGLGSVGYRHLVSVPKPFYKPEDLAGVKVRAMENDIYLATYEALGSNATPMAWGEVVTALQQGTVSALDLSMTTIMSNGTASVVKYISKTGHFYNAIGFCISESLWNEFTPEQQAFVQKAADAAIADCYDYVIEYDASSQKDVENYGIKVINTEEIDVAAFKAKCANLYDEFANKCGGAEWLAKYRAAFDAAE
jgi:tripartite ATP-independent transporter DctP family solute receptor